MYFVVVAVKDTSNKMHNFDDKETNITNGKLPLITCSSYTWNRHFLNLGVYTVGVKSYQSMATNASLEQSKPTTYKKAAVKMSSNVAAKKWHAIICFFFCSKIIFMSKLVRKFLTQNFLHKIELL